jgi:hypothetical protein
MKTALENLRAALRAYTDDGTGVDALRAPIRAFCAVARRYHVTAEHAIIALKDVMAEGIPRIAPQPGRREALRSEIITLAIDTYYAAPEQPVESANLEPRVHADVGVTPALTRDDGGPALPVIVPTINGTPAFGFVESIRQDGRPMRRGVLRLSPDDGLRLQLLIDRGDQLRYSGPVWTEAKWHTDAFDVAVGPVTFDDEGFATTDVSERTLQ